MNNKKSSINPDRVVTYDMMGTMYLLSGKRVTVQAIVFHESGHVHFHKVYELRPDGGSHTYSPSESERDYMRKTILSEYFDNDEGDHYE